MSGGNFTNSEQLFSDILATLVTTKFSLPTSFYGQLTASARELTRFMFQLNQTSLFNSLFSQSVIENISYSYIIYTCLMITLCYRLMRVNIANTINSTSFSDYIDFCNISKYFYKKYKTIEISELSQMKPLYNYLANSDFFITPYSLGVNKLAYEYSSYLRNTYKTYEDICELGIPDFDRVFDFYDSTFNVQGYIEWKKINCTEVCSSTNKEGNKTNEFIQVNKPLLKLSILDRNPNKYLKEVNDFIKESERYERNITTCFIDINMNADRIFSKTLDNLHSEPSMLAKDMEERKEKFIDTFFHPERDYLWNYINTIVLNPEQIVSLGQYPQLSLCLYGPPGTGKSSFAYRVARATGRNVIKVDLKSINSKYELESLLMGKVELAKANSSINKRLTVSNQNQILFDTSNSVFVLDEFDIAVRYLNAKAEEIKYRKDLIKKKIDSIFTNFQKENDKKSKNAELPKSDTTDDNNAEDANAGADTTEETSSDVVDDETDNLNKTLNMLQDQFNIDDLLDVLQGPVANNGSIIIATTNNYNEIRHICPRLFRDGRLKPTFFGYINQSTLNEITQYYFGRRVETGLNWLSDPIKIPTSRIMRIIIGIKIHETNEPYSLKYRKFMNLLKKEIETYRLSDLFVDYDRETDN